MNKIIKEHESYIILTPSHSTLKEYKKLNLNCSVIQKYSMFGNDIPSEQTIIIDEIGMCGYQEMLFLTKCNLMGKQILAFGDFNQLLPVGSNHNFGCKNFLSYLFNKIDESYTNHRNNFTAESYRRCFESDNIKFSKINEVLNK